MECTISRLCNVVRAVLRSAKSPDFAYRSNGAYGEREYGGVLEPIGDWAYYHE
ncbi:MAG: hypothetical protein ACE5R4_17400 [Armatimonadota bacterium]